MANPRSLPDGCASATSLLVPNAADTMIDVQAFLAQVGSVDLEDLSLHCSVVHPDGLHCTCLAEVFMHESGDCVVEMTRMRGDSVLFALVFKLLRAFLAERTTPELFSGQLLQRNLRGPAHDPATVPSLELPPTL